MRPASIQWFERLYLGSLGLGLVNLLVHYSSLKVALGSTGGQMGFVFLSFLVGIAISLMFWYLVARRASNLAKWFLVALVVIGLIGLPGSLRMTDMLGTTYIAIGALATLIQAAATGLLFTAESRRWFAAKGAPPSPDVFE